MMTQHPPATSVLIVEDEAITAMEIQSSLKRLGYRISAIAASGEQALNQARQTTPDLVLMDIKLKGATDGICIAEQLHTQLNIPVIYLTAFADEPTLQRAKQTQPYGFIVKPFQERELRSTIETAIYKHQMDKILHSRNRWYSHLLASLSEAVIITDMDQRITLVNPMAEALTGWDNERAQGKPITEVFLLEEQGEITHETSLVFLAISDHLPHQVEGILQKSSLDSSGTWVTASASLIRSAEDSPLGVALVFKDISQQKQAEEELRKSEIKIQQMQKMEAMGTLAGGIAHDFNNILTSILGFTQLALSKVSSPNSIEGNLQMILTGAYRAKDLVHQILTFSRHYEHEYRPVELQSLVTETLKLLRAALPATIILRQNLTEGTGMVLGDATQLQQVVMNLCTNAKQAIGKACGVLEVTLTTVNIEPHLPKSHPQLPNGPYLCLRIRDTGGGINPNVLPRIFDPFFTTKPVGEGTGMGLALVHGIITNHNGAIQVNSEPGKGTTVEIFLSKIDWQLNATNADLPQKPLAGEGRLLFVDDEVAITELAQEILEGLGYEVISFSNSLKALEFFVANPSQVDVVITDQTMPHVSGEQLVTQIQTIRKDIPIIMCTGFMTPQTQETMKALEIQTILTKPWTGHDLGHALHTILKGAR